MHFLRATITGFLSSFRSPRRCTLHEGVENDTYPYRCNRCGQCFVCAHDWIAYHSWVCRDGTHVSSTPSPGVPTPDSW